MVYSNFHILMILTRSARACVCTVKLLIVVYDIISANPIKHVCPIDQNSEEWTLFKRSRQLSGFHLDKYI